MTASVTPVLGQSFGGKGYRTYVLGSLTLIYTLNFVDRILISVVGRPIIEEFGLTNLQFGILTGIGFALFYTAMGIPIARLSEHVTRVRIIGVCILLWSMATVLCGFVGGFVTLLLARMAVGVGEAGCTPPANSLINDYYAPYARPAALGIYAMGVTIGSVLAQYAGGHILNLFSWREAFIYVGAPGILIGLLFLLTVKEAPRGFSDPPNVKRPQKASLKEALFEIAHKPTFWLVTAGTSMATFGGYGLTSFKSLYIQYSYGLSPGDAAIQYMAPIALAGAIGTPLAGFLIQYFSPRSFHAAVWVPAVGFFLSAPFLMFAYLANSIHVMFGLFLVAGIFQYFYIGASYNLVQTIVSLRVRATAIAILLFLINLIGYGAGPPVVGYLADVYSNLAIYDLGFSNELSATCNPKDARLGSELASICVQAKAYGTKWASIIGSIVFFLAGGFYLFAIRCYRRDLRI